MDNFGKLHFAITQRQKNNFYVKVGNFYLNYRLSQPFMNWFSKFLCLSCSKFFKTTQTFSIRMSRSRQNNRNKVRTQLWDTLYVRFIQSKIVLFPLLQMCSVISKFECQSFGKICRNMGMIKIITIMDRIYWVLELKLA